MNLIHPVSSISLEEIKAEINQYSDGDSFLKLMSNHFNFKSYEFRKIDKAHTLVVTDFNGMFRHTGEDFVEHLRRTALICFCYRGDKNHVSVLERLLHDWPEDVKDSNHLSLYKEFGSVVTRTVVGVTEPEVKRLTGMLDKDYKRLKQLAKFKKVVEAGSRSMILKCDDRFDNILTLFGTPERKLSKIIETMEWVLPISRRVDDVLLNELTAACVQQLERLHIDDSLNDFLT